MTQPLYSIFAQPFDLGRIHTDQLGSSYILDELMARRISRIDPCISSQRLITQGHLGTLGRRSTPWLVSWGQLEHTGWLKELGIPFTRFTTFKLPFALGRRNILLGFCYILDELKAQRIFQTAPCTSLQQPFAQGHLGTQDHQSILWLVSLDQLALKFDRSCCILDELMELRTSRIAPYTSAQQLIGQGRLDNQGRQSILSLGY